MEEIGRDFFLRVQLTRKVVWFVCPTSGNVYHSAAKPGGPGGRAKPGKRYCHLCKKVRGHTRRATGSGRTLPLPADPCPFPQPAMPALPTRCMCLRGATPGRSPAPRHAPLAAVR